MNEQHSALDSNLEFAIDELQITAEATAEQVCAAIYGELIRASDAAPIHGEIYQQHLWQAAENTAHEVLQATCLQGAKP